LSYHKLRCPTDNVNEMW